MRGKSAQMAALLLGAGAACCILAIWWTGGALISSSMHRVGPPPPGSGAVAVSFESFSGRPVHGWLFRGSNDKAVLLMHGSGGDRRSMLGRARMLSDAGYTALTIDLQGNGESPGAQETSGYLESLDAHAAVRFLREQLGAGQVGVVGFSLGGAAALLGPRGPVDADALVLEAVYPTIEDAVANRIELRLGRLGRWLTPLLTWQLRPRLGIGPEDLRPIDRIRDIRSPVLVIGGQLDRRTPPEETRALEAAAPPPKSLWIVPTAAHDDFFAIAPDEYGRRVVGFLDQALRKPLRGPERPRSGWMHPGVNPP